MEKIYEKALSLQKEKTVAKKEVSDKLSFTDQQLMLLTQEMKDKIHQMVEDVEEKVKFKLYYIFPLTCKCIFSILKFIKMLPNDPFQLLGILFC